VISALSAAMMERITPSLYVRLLIIPLAMSTLERGLHNKPPLCRAGSRTRPHCSRARLIGPSSADSREPDHQHNESTLLNTCKTVDVDGCHFSELLPFHVLRMDKHTCGAQQH
jgi:hypothetical protein